VLIQDATGNGESAVATGGPATIDLSSLPDPPVNLVPPLNVLFNLLSVSRGKTVSNEVLGSGDATVAGQEFVLQKSPLTYLQSGDSISGTGYKSTLKVWVEGVQWQEVQSFYGQPPDAHIFVTREDENNITHVQFGDGINGARLSSGVNNVVATYRYGSGKDSPDAGSLSVILQPQPGLKSIVNPVPVGGGADPDPPDQIRKYAPQSVLNFGRAVSGNDYETIAAQAPGVARAKAYWNWDPLQQRTMVTVYVGDDQNAVKAAQTALNSADDPNRPVIVNLATSVPVSLSFSLLVDPRYVAADVMTTATAALIDPDKGLLGANVIGIGQVIFESQIYEACLSIPGAVAVHALQFSVFNRVLLFRRLGSLSGFRFPILRFQPRVQPFRFDPGVGGFFQLQSSNLNISTEVASNG
jgi:predicted phage baseplate assembly protein